MSSGGASTRISASALLLWAISDVRNRHLRFVAALDELKRTSDPGARVFLGVARDRMILQLNEFDRRLDDTLSARDVEDNADPSTWTIVPPKLVDLTRDAFTKFSALHQELFPFLPLRRQLPADIGFFLSRSFGLEPTLPAHRAMFTLSLGRFTIWEAGVVKRHPMSVATVPIPFTETLTPLRWPLLVHELAHWYLPGGGSLSDIADVKLQERFGDVSAETKSTFEEIFADLVAFRAHGLTYCLAFALEAYLSSPAETTTQLLPSPRRRLRLLATEAFPRLVDESIPGIWPLDAGGGITDNRLIEISEVALELLEDFQPPRSQFTAVQQARQLLARGESASAVHADRQDIGDESFASLLAGGDFDMEAHERWLFAAATDEPCSDAEILEAAWLLEVDRPPVEILADLTARGASLDDAVAALATRDTSISRSLQSAAVHRWLREWDETIAANVEHGRSTAAVALPAADATGWAEDSPLSDVQLVRRLTRPREDALVIRPLIDPSQIGGTTVDLRLGTEWEQLRTSRFQALDPGADPEITGELLDNSADEYRLTSGRDQSVVLHPGELLLALTLEYLRLPDDLWGNIEGRSTWARLGLQVHATAGMVDCGFRGYLTLELQNTGRLPLVLFPGLRVAQMAFFPVHQVLNPYHGKPSAAYSAQTSARSAFHRQHEHKAMHRFLTDPKSRT